MTGYVDIHAHLLPGIDDGPEDLAGSLDMARAAADAGTTMLVATPHLRSDFPHVHVDELIHRCRAMQQAVDDDGIQLALVSGAEVSLAWALDADDAQLRLASIGGRGTDLLIETPDDVGGIERLLFTLQVKRYRITLAHPERSRQFQAHPGRVEALGDRGVLLAVNAEALLLPNHSRTRGLAERLCAGQRSTVLASDGHRAGPRRPVGALAQGIEAAAALVGADRATWMASTAPAAIVAGQPVPDPPAVHRTARRWPWRARIFSSPPVTATARRWWPIVLLGPLVAVAIAGFAVVRSQQGSGATLAAQQRAAQALSARAVDRVLRSAPDPVTHAKATDASCTAGRSGALRNPWQCTLTYAVGTRLSYRVRLSDDGRYVGSDQIVRKPGGRPYSASGKISGCCVAIP
jgi:protein-tyrosine phosphatase